MRPARPKALVLTLALLSAARAGSAAPAPGLRDLDQGEELVEQARDAKAHVARVFAEAKSEKDPLRLGCVREKQSRVEALTKVAEATLAAWTAAVREGRMPSAQHARDKLVLTTEKIAAYRREADQCVGSLAFSDASQGAERQVQLPAMPASDTLAPLSVGAPASQRPPPASPTR
jgi:hypothetical protein